MATSHLVCQDIHVFLDDSSSSTVAGYDAHERIDGGRGFIAMGGLGVDGQTFDKP
jgi:hypothetical protein